MVTWQVPVPEQSPDHPEKLETRPGVAVRVTSVPASKETEQVPGQVIPVGVLATDPEPVPTIATLSVHTATKVAVTGYALRELERPAASWRRLHQGPSAIVPPCSERERAIGH